jgi:mono/diheme cytochrome c family protein
MNARKVLSAVIILSLGMAGAASADPQSDLVARGKYLTDAGDCIACHQAPGGKPFAGGLRMSTPFGTLQTPNITPDKDTGIGKWTDAQFYQALHEGIAPRGKYLYPVFPFPWFTRVTHDDVMAIRAYLATVPAVHEYQNVNQLSFPFNIRASLIGWRQLFFTAKTFQPDPNKSAKLNRGAYLVEGLGHCAECHTPHDPLGAIDQAKAFEGAKIDDWYAPNISSDMSQGIGSWSEDALVEYFKTGVAPDKSIAAGPMAETIHDSLSKLTDADLHAIAAYLKQLPAKPTYTPAVLQASAPNAEPIGRGAYLNYCSSCHREDGKGVEGAIPPLDGNGVVVAGGPQDIIKTVLGGMIAHGAYALMPAVGAALSDQQIADVTNYIRGAWSNHAPANAGPGMVGTLRPDTVTMLNGGPCGDLRPELADAGLTKMLSGLNEANMPERMPEIVTAARHAVPNDTRADLVNQLTAAYCPLLKADATVPAALKPQHLGSFAGLVYSQLAEPGGLAEK